MEVEEAEKYVLRKSPWFKWFWVPEYTGHELYLHPNTHMLHSYTPYWELGLLRGS